MNKTFCLLFIFYQIGFSQILSDSLGKRLLHDRKNDGLIEVDFLAKFKNPLNQDIFLFNGLSQYLDGEENNLFIIKQSSDSDSIIIKVFDMPGKAYDYLGSKVYAARVFYGNCVEKYSSSIIWYQSIINDDGNWVTNYFILDFSSDKPKSISIKEKDVDLKKIFKKINTKECFELDGIEVHYTP